MIWLNTACNYLQLLFYMFWQNISVWKDIDENVSKNAVKMFDVFSGHGELWRFSREWNLIAPMHNYEISSTIPENWKLISLTVSENTSGQNDTQNFTKTSIYDVIFNVTKNKKICIKFKWISIIPENLTQIHWSIFEKSPAQNL